MSFRTALDKVGTQAVKEAIEAAHDEAIAVSAAELRRANYEIRFLKNIVKAMALVMFLAVVWLAFLTGYIVVSKFENAEIAVPMAMVQEVEGPEGVPAVDASTPLIKAMVINSAETLGFRYQVVENGRYTAFGNVACPEEGPVLYHNSYESLAQTASNDGVWIAVEGCGEDGYDLKDFGDVARIYLPIESLARVSSGYDFMEAVKRDGVLYWINQDLLAQALALDPTQLPVNQDLPTAP